MTLLIKLFVNILIVLPCQTFKLKAVIIAARALKTLAASIAV